MQFLLSEYTRTVLPQLTIKENALKIRESN